jgi:hypothetical protein
LCTRPLTRDSTPCLCPEKLGGVLPLDRAEMVVGYDPSLRETVVASGWGERSDWYRNLEAHPALEDPKRTRALCPRAAVVVA